MRPISFFSLLLAITGLHPEATLHADTPRHPNVLFIAIDDLVTTIGAYGDPIASTPQIDRLGARGTVFRGHYVQWPVCGPSRAALTTGLMPEETGVMGFRPIRALLPDVITLPQHFRSNGYATAAAGKFHDPRTVGDIVSPDEPTTNGRNIDDPLSWSVPYAAVPTAFDPPDKRATDASDRPEADYADHKILMQGKALLEQFSKGDAPFFLAVGFKKPHLPFVAPKSFWDVYDRNAFDLASFKDMPAGIDLPNSQTDERFQFNNELLGYTPYLTSGLPTAEEERELIHGYYACVSFVDKLVGDLIDQLETLRDPIDGEKTLAETTIVVLWGDHGFHLGDHNRWAKHSIMEQSAVAPLIIFDPRQPAHGLQNFNPVNTVDIFPTLCELANLEIPTQPSGSTAGTGRPLRGKSLVPMLLEEARGVHSGALTHISSGGLYGYAYRTRQFRYVEWINHLNVVKTRELYDYAMDPLETRNVANEPGYASIVFQLSRAIRAETVAGGTSRLLKALPQAGPANSQGLFLPNLKLNLVGPSNGTALALSGPLARGLRYAVELASHPDFSSHVDQSALSGMGIVHLPVPENTTFYRIRLAAGAPPRFTADPFPLPPGRVGLPYTYALGEVLDNPEPAGEPVFEMESGPQWLSLSSDGILSGNPVVSGNYYLRVRFSDTVLGHDTNAFNMRIDP